MVQNLYVKLFLWILDQILSKNWIHKIPCFSKQKIIETKIKSRLQKMVQILIQNCVITQEYLK